MPVGSSTSVYYSPSTILKEHKPPIAAYLRTPTHPPGLDLSRPLLLYSHYISTKVRGNSLRLYHDGTLSDIGPSLVIPETYSGWFSIINRDGQSAPSFTTIGEVVCAKVSFFLSRFDVAAFCIKEDDCGNVSCRRVTLPSGHVLKLLGSYQGLNLLNAASNRRHSTAGGDEEEAFAQCLTYKNEIVYFPLATRGKFYATAQKSSKNMNKIFLITQLIKNFKLPLTAKLVCGQMPRAPCAFTGILRLEKSYQEEVILACTMTSEAYATLFEIEVDSSFHLTPILDPLFAKSPIYLKTISYCQDESDLWQRQIKVTHHVTEKRSRSLTRSLSNKIVDPFGSTRSLKFSFLSELKPRKVSKDWHSLAKSRFWDSFNDKETKKKAEKETRRLAKQNTYVFQTIRRQADLLGIPKFINARLSQSVDNLEYPRHKDRVSPISEDKRIDEEDSHYSVIGEPPPKKEKSVPPSETQRQEDSSQETPSSSRAQNDTTSEDSDHHLTNPNFGSQGRSNLRSGVEKQPHVTEGETVSVMSIRSYYSNDCEDSSKSPEPSVPEKNCENDTKTEDKTCDIKLQNESKITSVTDTNIKMDQLQNKDKDKDNAKSKILMRGNTIVIRVKDTEYRKPMTISNCFDPIDSSNENEAQLLNKPNSDANEELHKDTNNKESDNTKNNQSINKKNMTMNCDKATDPQTDANETSTCNLEEDNSNHCNNKRTEGCLSLSNAQEDLNSIDGETIKVEIKEGVREVTEKDSNLSVVDSDSVAYKMGVSYNSFDTLQLQSLDDKTYFCINDIPKDHIFHNIDIKHLKADRIYDQLKEMESNPIFMIKNGGNVTFTTLSPNETVATDRRLENCDIQNDFDSAMSFSSNEAIK